LHDFVPEPICECAPPQPFAPADSFRARYRLAD
jgi:hypothetical protein